MLNFTEGDWEPVGRDLWNNNHLFAEIYGSESDARLMAQSKKMYELLSDWEDDIGTRQAEGANYNPGTLNVLRRTRAILSEIDKED